MPRPTKNSSSPVQPQLASRQRKEKTPLLSNPGRESDINPDDLSEECRSLYVLLSRKLDSVIEEVRVRDARLERCEQDNAGLKKKVNELEGRLDEVETRNRASNLIISGKTLSGLSNDNLSHSVTQLLRNKIQYELSPNNIVSAYRIGSRPPAQSPDHRNVMLKLHEGSVKRDIQSACRIVKPSELYTNDDLTPHRANLLYLLRRAKRRANGKIVACGSADGSVYAFIRSTGESTRNQKVYIKSMERLVSLCDRELGIPLRELTEGLSSA